MLTIGICFFGYLMFIVSHAAYGARVVVRLTWANPAIPVTVVLQLRIPQSALVTDQVLYSWNDRRAPVGVDQEGRVVLRLYKYLISDIHTFHVVLGLMVSYAFPCRGLCFLKVVDTKLPCRNPSIALLIYAYLSAYFDVFALYNTRVGLGFHQPVLRIGHYVLLR